MIIFLCFLFLYIQWGHSRCQSAFITEVLADPTLTPDSESEFIEIYFPSSSQGCSFLLSLEGQTIFQAQGSLEDQFKTTLGIPQSIPNNKALHLTLSYTDLRGQANSTDTILIDETIAPMPQPGLSWERDFWQDLPGDWMINSSHQSTPGESHPTIQSNFLNCFWEDHTIICNQPHRIKLLSYSSIDFNHWTLVDSTQSKLALTRYTPDSLPHSYPYIKQLIQGDLFQGDNQKITWRSAPAKLQTLHIQANENEPEWIQIFLHTPIDSLYIQKRDKQYHLPPLPQGECTLTQDSLTWRDHFGDLRICLYELSPFPTLSNQGDTLYLNHQGAVLDSVIWEAKDSIINTVTLDTILPMRIQLLTTTLFSPLDLQFNLPQSLQQDTIMVQLQSLKGGSLFHQNIHPYDLERIIRKSLTENSGIHFALRIKSSHGIRNFTLHKLYDIE